MLKRKKEFVAALVVVVLVFVLLALPYAMTQVYGLEAMELTLLLRLAALAFSAALLIWWRARYRQTSHDIETLRKEIERAKLSPENPGTTRKREVNQKECDKKK